MQQGQTSLKSNKFSVLLLKFVPSFIVPPISTAALNTMTLIKTVDLIFVI